MARNGKRQIRTKRAIVNILREYPEGLTVPELQVRLKDSSKGSRACPNNNALSQICKRMIGVQRSEKDKYLPVSDNESDTRAYAVYVLTDENAFEEWAGKND